MAGLKINLKLKAKAMNLKVIIIVFLINLNKTHIDYHFYPTKNIFINF